MSVWCETTSPCVEASHDESRGSLLASFDGVPFQHEPKWAVFYWFGRFLFPQLSKHRCSPTDDHFILGLVEYFPCIS